MGMHGTPAHSFDTHRSTAGKQVKDSLTFQRLSQDIEDRFPYDSQRRSREQSSGSLYRGPLEFSDYYFHIVKKEIRALL